MIWIWEVSWSFFFLWVVFPAMSDTPRYHAKFHWDKSSGWGGVSRHTLHGTSSIIYRIHRHQNYYKNCNFPFNNRLTMQLQNSSSAIILWFKHVHTWKYQHNHFSHQRSDLLAPLCIIDLRLFGDIPSRWQTTDHLRKNAIVLPHNQWY